MSFKFCSHGAVAPPGYCLIFLLQWFICLTDLRLGGVEKGVLHITAQCDANLKPLN